jgi:hypothetical protein
MEDIIARVSGRAMTGGRDSEMSTDDDAAETTFFRQLYKCGKAEAIAVMPQHTTITLTGRAGPSITVAATADTHQNPENEYIHCPFTGKTVSAPAAATDALPAPGSPRQCTCGTARPITASLAILPLR